MKIMLRKTEYITAREVSERRQITLAAAMKIVKGHPLTIEMVNPHNTSTSIRLVPAIAVNPS